MEFRYIYRLPALIQNFCQCGQVIKDDIIDYFTPLDKLDAGPTLMLLGGSLGGR